VLDKWRVDELYDSTVLALSRFLGMVAGAFDRVVVDGLLTKVTASTVQGLGFVLTRLQNGLVQAYAAVMVAGLLVVLWFFAVPHVLIDVPAAPSGDAVELQAQAGLGYQYRWDFGSDGSFDTDWGQETNASHTYADAEMQAGMVAVLEPAVYAAGLRHKRLKPGKHYALEPDELGPNWQSEPGKGAPPTVEATKEGLLVHANGARLRKDGNSLSDKKVVLKRGEHVDVGQARLTAAGLARATLRVRNAFGVEREASHEMVLPEVTPRPAVEVVGMAEAKP
jgi:NADH-quinone oxidoreductase subunit L